MALVYDLIKDREIHSIDADRTVLEAARYMMEHRFGVLPVMRDGELVGILSERDIMTRVVAAGRTPGTTRIAEVMTPKPRTIGTDETIEECLFLMREYGFRHLLVADGEQLKGVVSLRDILMKYLAEKESEGRREAS